MQLRYDDPFGSVDHKGALFCHVGDVSQKDLLFNGLKVFVVLVIARQAQFGLERHGVRQSAVYAFIHRILGGINSIVDELQYEILA